jgi:hypothetical protein
MNALPPAALMLRTHCTFSSSIDTRYRYPLTTANATGSEIVRPEARQGHEFVPGAQGADGLWLLPTNVIGLRLTIIVMALLLRA